MTFSSLAYFTVRKQYIMHTEHAITVSSQGFWSTACCEKVAFGRVKSCMCFQLCVEVSAPNPRVVQGSTVSTKMQIPRPHPHLKRIPWMGPKNFFPFLSVRTILRASQARGPMSQEGQERVRKKPERTELLPRAVGRKRATPPANFIALPPERQGLPGHPVSPDSRDRRLWPTRGAPKV